MPFEIMHRDSESQGKFLIDLFSLGQSGCSLSVEYGKTGPRVTKQSHAGIDDKITLRLHKQYLKHVRIQEQGLMDPISVPKVLDAFSGNGYSMSLAPGLPLGLALNTMSRWESLQVALKLGQYFETSLDAASAHETVNGAVTLKLEELSAFYKVARDKQLSIIGSNCANMLRAYFSKTRIGASFNHGDFSFENIMVSRGSRALTALDFLDSPFESLLIDVGRLWLDLNGGWWIEGLNSSPTATLNAREIAVTIETALRKFGIDRRQIDFWACFAGLRVAPYTRNPTRLALLKFSLARTLEVYS